ncbi:hypothetical protein [Winogradskyella alexanderae]|uniref:Uncharacterized protein n=1 Tax=Winogradskyella alexanderae TaxID=2877123 RepID=A0ABS7XUY1_9FLAO|nr:hypothetical protein [Winogradskyella alexanderae]MCA0133832.1 hypothetical protein [Winogradskyella alexanderae]
MNRFLLRIIMSFFLLCSYGVIAQTAKNVQFNSVNYTPNVNAPLTTNELNKIKEVYQDHTQVMLNDEHQLKRLKHLLRNRLNIMRLDKKDKQRNYIPLSEIELFNYYNPNLKRDLVFDMFGFNPLKYNLNFFPTENMLYRIDGTNYFIQVKSQFQ